MEKLEATNQKTKHDYELEFASIAFNLLDYHSIFYMIIQLGCPIFEEVEGIETAAVSLNKEENKINFFFNPHFWDSIDDLTRSFIISHECLHVILNHNFRLAETKHDQFIANIAFDIVVNHMLVESFGFDRTKIQKQDQLCWVDTVFGKDGKSIPTNLSYENYYGMLLDSAEVKKMSLTTIDQHISGDDFEKIIEEIESESNSTLDKEQIEDLIDKISNDKPNSSDKDRKKFGYNNVSKPGGIGERGDPLVFGNEEFYGSKEKVNVKRKWQSVIKLWDKKDNIVIEEQWTNRPRRMSALDRDLMLPYENEFIKNKKNKLDLFFFLDCSGSCYHLTDRFFNAARSIDTNIFNVRLFSRTTKVKETTLKEGRLFRGGSDRFQCMEDFIQEELENKRIKKYPYAIFHITDGGDCALNKMTCKYPERWYWFLTTDGKKSTIPKGSNIFYLKDFE